MSEADKFYSSASMEILSSFLSQRSASHDLNSTTRLVGNTTVDQSSF